ncbi:GAF domain-containing protein [Desulfopila sp. IMCC35006]|uniref:GAF domain-containing protein n=1 Tax=Desulfopila sp. IMCC35006 TaxID=2569542 RepID=UPI0010ABBB52|nr:GAF domain-containing protein [Desulfopila sp. IMCC35006]TKB24181.1 GAF domain-containing protein [Desulfopila sp. IMCC35006]
MTRETDYFQSFCKISKAFGTAATREELLSLIVDSAVASMEGKAACLFLADDREDIFVAKAQVGLSDNYLHANPMQAHKIVAALDKDGYLAFSDATSDPRLVNHEAKKAEGIASLLTVPVRIKNRNIGVLSLYTAERREFQPKEIDYLCALADQAGIAIENNRLHRRMHKNAMLFLELAANINSSLDIRQVLNNLTVNICDKLGLKGAVIRLVDDDGQGLKLVASHGLSDQFLKRSRNTYSKTAQRALKGETIIIRDSTTDSSITFKEAMKTEGVVSMIVTPILAREKVIGVLRLYSDVERDFPDDVILMVKALAHQGGLAIQNASMFLQLEKDKKSLEEDIWSYRSWF